MPKKVALLIGVSEYEAGLPALMAAPNDVAAMQRVLQDPKLCGFDEVVPLINPDLVGMQRAIKKLFASCERDDLALLFFSGHGLTDDDGNLYLTTRLTAKDDFEATAVPARFVQDVMTRSYAKRQVVILDCCYSGAFAEGWRTKSVGVDIRKQLGAEGRAVLTSSTATQTSFEQEGASLSLYTQYFVEGIETGAADRDGDGRIYVRELHEYAKEKVQDVKPKMKPEIILDKEGFNIMLSQAPINDSEVEYRKLVDRYASHGEISQIGREILNEKRKEIGITPDKADEIEGEVLEPYRKRLKNLQRYEQTLTNAVQSQYPLPKQILNELKDFRDILGLRDEDVAPIETRITSGKEVIHSKAVTISEGEINQSKGSTHSLNSFTSEELSTNLEQSINNKDTRSEVNSRPLIGSRLHAIHWLGMGLFGVVGLCVIAIVMTVGMWAIGDSDADAKFDIHEINKAQKKFYIEKARFASRLEELSVPIIGNGSYSYKIFFLDPTKTLVTATAKRDNLRSYTGIVVAVNLKSNNTTKKYILDKVCVTEQPSKIAPEPQVNQNVILCSPSSSEVSY